MRTVLELPDPVFDALKTLAESEGRTLETLILHAIHNELKRNRSEGYRHVQLPLIRSNHPGSLRSLTNAEVDDLQG